MNANVLKIIAGALVAVAASLEAQQVLPAGFAAAVGGALTFLAGMFHPQPGSGAK